MARRRGFLAEINRQAKEAERREHRQRLAAARAQAAAERAAEKAQRDYARALAAAERASQAEQKAAQREAERLHAEARTAEAAALNSVLESTYAEIDSLLASTLENDDFIDLDALKVDSVEHPPFTPGALAVPPRPVGLEYPPEPRYVEPPAPAGLAAMLGGKKKHETAVAQMRAHHETVHRQWWDYCRQIDTKRTAFQHLEADRIAKLERARENYEVKCRVREAEAKNRNEEIEQLKNNLAFDLPEAIEEYVALVLSNSVYPEAFPVRHHGTFDLPSRELTLTVTVPLPSAVPCVKSYRYVKSKDLIQESVLSAKAQKDRYASAVWQVAVRTLHEVFEADREGKIDSIAMTVAAERLSPATGNAEIVPLVIAAAGREEFNGFDLANVVPSATLEHLGAALSKSPFDLAPADASVGVRARGRK
ncbi:restriction system protein [Austwickia chelonae]|uniref:Restriction system protein n=1 Tax=Austwickia chelonae NBRC 105200 TaxID=1184607 RepID=K6UN87_9MICO|nr:hypothetical protein [Austwickia chelonae]GAB78771.1 hypothetical protein AUCHE_16_01940 [Austwickia chelonae NBRC 105200]SEW35334.1 restriction system protein [Austwickia chelonae]